MHIIHCASQTGSCFSEHDTLWLS